MPNLEPLPCPLCGREAESSWDAEKETASIGCSECNLRLYRYGERALAHAVCAWNTRVWQRPLSLDLQESVDWHVRTYANNLREALEFIARKALQEANS